MRLFLVGDTIGRLDRLYENIGKVADEVGPPDWVLHVGSFGVWPHLDRLDRSTRRNAVGREFAAYLRQEKPVPFRTLFVPGRHDDHRWLSRMAEKAKTDPLPNLFFTLSGVKRDIPSAAGERLRVMGLSGVFSPNTYSGPSRALPYQYSVEDVSRACAQGPVDLLLTSEAGRGARVGAFESLALGINNIAFATRAVLHVHAHYGVSQVYRHPTTGTLTVSLGREEILAVKFEEGRFDAP